MNIQIVHIHFEKDWSLFAPKRFKSLISAVKYLEDTLKTNHIDIEFAMNDKLEPILFQARPLTGTTKWDFEQLEKSDSLIVSTKSDLENALKVSPKSSENLISLGKCLTGTLQR